MRIYHAIAGILILAFCVQAGLSLSSKSLTTDEPVYITAGYYHLRSGRFDYNNTNPPLLKILSALPLLIVKPDLLPMSSDPKGWNEVAQWQYARSFIYKNRTDAEILVWLARAPIVILGAMLGVLLFVWTKELYGPWAAILGLTLFAFSPNLLAHTRLATQDLGLALFVVLSAYLYWRYLRSPGLRYAVLLAVSMTAAVLAKTGAIFLILALVGFSAALVLRGKGEGMWRSLLVVAGIRQDRVRLAQMVSFGMLFAVVGVVGIFLINLLYLFEGSLEPLAHHMGRDLSDPNRGSIKQLLLAMPLPLPSGFVDLLLFQIHRVAGGHGVYFAGEVSATGWWYLMPAALLIKTPIPLLILVGAALGCAAVRRRLGTAEWLLVAVIFSYIVGFSFLKGSNVGLRYILPIFPFFHILAARLMAEPIIRDWRAAAGLGGLLIWYVAGTVSIHPHYLAYFNESIGGPKNGYKYLADSFLDWGQDLKGLKKFLDETGTGHIRLAYFGSADAAYHGIDYEYLPSVGLAPKFEGQKWWYETEPSELPPFDPDAGTTAVSATLLAGVFLPGYYAELKHREPDAMVGYSILIFHPEGAASGRTPVGMRPEVR